MSEAADAAVEARNVWSTLKFLLDRASADVWQVIVAVVLCLLLAIVPSGAL